MFDAYLDGLLGPFLRLPALWAIAGLSLVLTIIITFIYKWVTDQHLMKTLKDDLKKFQQEMKEFKHDPQKVLEVQKRAMETNMKYMMHSFKPMLITMLPVLIIFGWLNANFAYLPIMPDTEFSVSAIFDKSAVGEVSLVLPEELVLLSDPVQPIVDDQASWFLKGSAGDYLLEFEYEGKTFNRELLITSEQDYKPVDFAVKNSNLKILRVNNQKLTPLSIFGWRIGWLGTYIIFSMVFNIILRRLLGVH